jgi:hypothetical protein
MYRGSLFIMTSTPLAAWSAGRKALITGFDDDMGSSTTSSLVGACQSFARLGQVVGRCVSEFYTGPQYARHRYRNEKNVGPFHP